VDAALSLGDEQRAANPPRYADAEKAYTLAASLSKDARPYVGLGNLYYDQKKYAEAEAAYRRAGQLNPADGIAYARLAFMYSEMFQGARARRSRRRSSGRAARWPHNPPTITPRWLWLDHLSEGRLQRGGDGLSALDRAIAAGGGLYIELARVLNSERRYREALTPLNKAIELEPKNYTAHFFAGIVQQKLGQLDKAADQYNQA